jgi:hypothetical protein
MPVLRLDGNQREISLSINHLKLLNDREKEDSKITT